MKFHIHLDSDNIFNFNSYFVPGVIAIKKKNTSERKTWEPNSADKGKALH